MDNAIWASTLFWGAITGVTTAFLMECLKPGMIFSSVRTKIAEWFIVKYEGWKKSEFAEKRNEFETETDYEYYITDYAIGRYKLYKPLLGCAVCSQFWINLTVFAFFVFLGEVPFIYFPLFFSSSYFLFVLTYGR